MCALLEGWVANVSVAAVGQHLHTEESESCGPRRGDHARCQRECPRAEGPRSGYGILEGSSRFLGDPGLPPIAGDGFFPLSDPAWLLRDPAKPRWSARTRGATRPRTMRGPAWDALHPIVLSAISGEIRQAHTEWQERLHEKTEADQRLADSAVERLGAVLETSRDGVGLEVATGDPLLAACQVVGRAMGVEFRRPEQSGGMGSDPLDEISRASRVRMRRVALRGMVASGRRSVAGVQGGRRASAGAAAKGTAAYTLVDPVGGEGAAGYQRDGYRAGGFRLHLLHPFSG